ncbi:HNH endonuclease [Alicyclobacillus sp. SO9]|nr:HNH endonuclease [Alicyclobacillus sp. SO9]
MKSFKANHQIKSNVPKRRRTESVGLFTNEQKTFIKDNVKGLSNQKLADLVNKRFGVSITARQMNTWKKNHGLSSGLKGSEGMSPPNKGTRGIYNVGGNKTSFKRGARSHNYMPVGSERVNADDYVDIKIADPNRWRGKHLIVWEEHHGQRVPKGYVVIFGDRNRRNFAPDNLILVSRAQLAVMNKHGLIQDNAELTRLGMIVADLYQKISQRKRG